LEVQVAYNDYEEVAAYDEALEKKQYQDLLNDLVRVIDTEAGKNVLWHILSQCGIYDGGFVNGELAYFNQGLKEVGLRIIGLMHDADLAMYAKLQLRMTDYGRDTD
jgi:hypothetical protein